MPVEQMHVGGYVEASFSFRPHSAAAEKRSRAVERNRRGKHKRKSNVRMRSQRGRKRQSQRQRKRERKRRRRRQQRQEVTHSSGRDDEVEWRVDFANRRPGLRPMSPPHLRHFLKKTGGFLDRRNSSESDQTGKGCLLSRAHVPHTWYTCRLGHV
jgi:hypothetical protein